MDKRLQNDFKIAAIIYKSRLKSLYPRRHTQVAKEGLKIALSKLRELKQEAQELNTPAPKKERKGGFLQNSLRKLVNKWECFAPYVKRRGNV